jgi:hypothetical protein
MPLSVASYDRAERQAVDSLPNRIIEACRPELFLKVGYPVEVASESGLSRFVDVMHENRDAADYKNLLDGFTHDEFELFKEISTKVAKFSGDRFGKRIVPKGALTRAMLSYRHIRMLAEPNSFIFEVGPGSGYLGALLATAGYRYGATDITQGFYLYQNHLWDYLFGGRLLELAESDQTFARLGDLPEGCVLHVPWWKYTISRPAEIDSPVDLYVANHALCEMNLYSMCYTIRLSHQLLSKSQRNGFFFIEGTGGETLRSRATALHHFKLAKFAQAFDDGGLIDVLAPASRMKDLVVGSQDQPAIPPKTNIAPGPITRLRRGARHVMNVVRNNGGLMGTTIKARRYFFDPSRRVPVSEVITQISEQTLTHDAWQTSAHRRILEQREVIARQPKIDFDEVRAFQRSLVPDEDIWSGDEQFFQYVFGTTFYS